jgi:acetyl/propionyl-CoA carboxylase alpha subunit
MSPQSDSYEKNPLVHRDRRLGHASGSWVRSFACEDMGVLIVCRGPVRKEAIEIFREMGIERVGILLSERDSIVYSRALSPEMRIVDPGHVHHIADYTGATKEERQDRINQMISICERHGYDSIFAGYGFMAEDSEFVRSLEEAGIRFIGPASKVQAAAGAKDQAKRTALANDVSVTPGVDNATTLTLLRLHADRAALSRLAAEHSLKVQEIQDKAVDLNDAALKLLEASYSAGIDLFSIEDLAETCRLEAARLLSENPGRRFRLKAIGGGGGKGQRIFSDDAPVPELARDILAEVKANGVGDNKNMLIELNVESTRHNEIQILGNGEWCVTLGGRDCSLQMHEQKLVEISLTQEGLQKEAEASRSRGDDYRAKVLTTDLRVLERMEQEAERFGLAVGLDSASTFECIIEGDRHYFMEVNTRIQVEHRVSELCYALRFQNPAKADEFFDVHSLIEAMALVAKHGKRLPRPERVAREGAAIEVRLNATDDALQAAAGGLLLYWSDPTEGEIRDDQGLSLKNPDTGQFMRYRLAGAYDSNIALLLSTGEDRHQSWARLSEVLRRTRMNGMDLSTNRTFHVGIMNWFQHRDPWAKPTTGFVVPYLTLVGLLEQEAKSIDLEYSFRAIEEAQIDAADPEAKDATRRVFDRKETLVERPIHMLFQEPHLLSGWLSQHRADVLVEGGRVKWLRNPIEVLAMTYHLLDLVSANAPAAERLWSQDRELLDTAGAFYTHLSRQIPEGVPWPQLDEALRNGEPSFGIDADTWHKVRGAHLGHQLGLEMLGLLPLVGDAVGFEELAVQDDLEIDIPERLQDKDLQDAMKKVLAPPPVAAANEISSAMGGVYWNREAPDLPPFLEVGDHFEKDDTLYVIEVMKMYNKLRAPFSGTIEEIYIEENGVVVRKGQPLFRIEPDEMLVIEDPEKKAQRVRAHTEGYVKRLR